MNIWYTQHRKQAQQKKIRQTYFPISVISYLKMADLRFPLNKEASAISISSVAFEGSCALPDSELYHFPEWHFLLRIFLPHFFTFSHSSTFVFILPSLAIKLSPSRLIMSNIFDLNPICRNSPNQIEFAAFPTNIEHQSQVNYKADQIFVFLSGSWSVGAIKEDD